MKKYKLINLQTKQEHLCDKVTIDGFDYYVKLHKITNCYEQIYYIIANQIYQATEHSIGMEVNLIIASNNFNLKYLNTLIEEDNLEILAYKYSYGVNPPFDKDKLYRTEHQEGLLYGYRRGYKKSQETHPFSENDMIEFKDFCDNYKCRCKYGSFMVSSHPCKKECQNQKNSKELLQLWKEQKIKTVYYE